MLPSPAHISVRTHLVPLQKDAWWSQRKAEAENAMKGKGPQVSVFTAVDCEHILSYVVPSFLRVSTELCSLVASC